MNSKPILVSLASLGVLAALSLLIIGLGSESVLSRSISATAPICGTWSVIADKPSGLLQGGKRLLGVAAISDDNVWAVGIERPALGSDQALVNHWTGTKWEKADLPHFGSNNGLADIIAISDHDIWAVGYKDGNTLVLHWDGRQWTIVPSPDGINSTGNELRGISAISPTDIWAVGNSLGSPLAIHWDGNKWSAVPIPRLDGLGNALNSVSGVTSNDVWAVGYLGSGSFQALMMHWDGNQWNLVPSQSVPRQSTDSNENHELASVGALGANDVWAVGWTKYFTSSKTLIEHWDGAEWHVVSSPNTNLGSNILSDVFAVSRDNIWAVGEASRTYTEPEQTLVEHWDGNQWQVIPGPNLFGSQGFHKAAMAANGVLWIGGEADGQAMIASFRRLTPDCRPN